MPDSVEKRLRTLKFFDGLPDKDTVEKVYDNLDFMRGVDVFLPTAAVQHQPENSAVSYQLSFLLLAHSVTCETFGNPNPNVPLASDVQSYFNRLPEA